MCGLSTEERAFLAAAREGRLVELQELLHGDVDHRLAKTETYRETALDLAVMSGHVDVVRFLLTHVHDGSYVKVLEHAVDAAVRNNHVLVLKVLAEHALVRASWAGDMRCMAGLLQFGVDPNQRDGVSALNEAARRGHVAAVKLLLEHGADVNLKGGPRKAPALLTAATLGRVEVVKVLVTHGADVHAMDEVCATMGKLVDSLLTLLDSAVAVPRLTALHEAWSARPEAEEVALLLLEHGFDPSITDSSGWTALLHACAMGNAKTAETILKRVTDVDAAGMDGSTALFYACRTGIPVDIIHTLLYRGADPLHIGGRRQTILHSACQRGDAELVKLFISLGVDVDAIDGRTRKTALHYAVWDRSGAVVRLLLQHGVDTQIADGAFLSYEPYNEENEEDFDTALSEACAASRIEVVELLMKHGSKASHAALNAACLGGQVELVQALLAHNLDPNESQDPPLFMAASRDHHEVVKLLLADGANVHARDSSNRTALYGACTSNSETTVALLLDQGVDTDAQDVDGKTPVATWLRHKVA
ncbi:hypothetical protein Poli38472_001926 [Pythium oligandrum]|uniref:Ankyrin repeat protein n=1 Tax=Pythium oligandrum TaxID=41045 RepID=A0A8K1CW40_PYTOL|nr:hypothetical protein Poli38472_001926 [Pythium oligandrum]|eukprot:TMW69770.1 hypothetical protein Poli38472_001926 [Pythium oligandrum]